MTEVTKCILVITTGIVCTVCIMTDPDWTPFALICFGIVTIVATRR